MKEIVIELGSEEIVELEKYLSNCMFNRDNDLDFRIVYNIYDKIRRKSSEITSFI